MFPVLPPTGIFALLSPATFTSFVLVPHIAGSLIAVDRGMMFEDACDVMVEMGDYGQRVFPEDDDDSELEEILEENVCMACVARGKAKDVIDITNLVCSDLACHQYSLG
jgi:hypothetical protein